MYLSVMSAVILWDVPAYNYNVTCIESKMKMYTYWFFFLTVCGEIVNLMPGEEVTITTPNYPDKLYHINMYWVHLAMRRIRPHKLSAQQIIKASSCHQIRLYILLHFKE
jgi:hypothetical protein